VQSIFPKRKIEIVSQIELRCRLQTQTAQSLQGDNFAPVLLPADSVVVKRLARKIISEMTYLVSSGT